MPILFTRLPAMLGQRVSGVVHRCPGCGAFFLGRTDAVTCSAACRMAASRERQREAAAAADPEVPQT